MSRLRWASLVVAVALGLPAAAIGEGPAGAPTVLFSPGMQEALDTTYGGSEGAVLRQTIREGVGTALCGTGCDARPTHPTDRQIGDNAALDRLLTHYGG